MYLQKSIEQSLHLLKGKQRRKYFFLVTLQCSTVVLDLIAIGLIGIVSRLAMGEDDIDAIIRYVPPLQGQGVTTFLLMAIFLFTCKSVISIVIIRKLLNFLTDTALSTSEDLFDKFSNGTVEDIHAEKSQHVAFAIGTGVNVAIVEVLTSCSIFLSEVVGLLILMMLAISVNVVIGFGCFAYFLLIVLFMQSKLRQENNKAGRIRAQTEIDGNEVISHYMFSFREYFAMGESMQLRSRFLGIRSEASIAVKIMQWSNLLPKYILESSLLIGVGLLMFYVTEVANELQEAGFIGVFLGIGFRVVPGLLRMQAALNTIRNSSAAGKPTLDFYHRLDSTLSTKVSRKVAPMTSFADIEFKNVSFKYRTREDFNISEVSFHAESGATIALVGKSGSGKSTIADLISGVLLPASGSVSIGGLSAREWINSHPRKMIYIPQAVGILNSSLIDNICLGIPKHIQDRDLAIQIINDLDLGSMLEALPDGLDSALGENAVQLSGGQRQRIGLARSLYFKPSLIIMDESTNALDAETEASIRSFASSSTSGVTKIIVAHKLSLLNDVNRILFFENGRILFEGDFAAMSKFSKFKNLFGLTD